MKPRKLTLEQVERIRLIAAARHALPTNAQLATEMGCCKRLVDAFSQGREYKLVSATKLHECLIELGLEKP